MITIIGRVVGFLLLALGCAGLLTANYINGRVSAGKEEINEGQERLDSNTEIFSFTPLTEEIGKSLVAPEQNEINEGRREAAHYEGVSTKLHTWGIVLLIAGGIVVVLSYKRIIKNSIK